MIHKKTLITATAVIAGTALALSAPLAASAHVGVTPSSTAAGAYTVLSFAIPHGCDGSPTTRLSFDIPDEVVAVTPAVNPNWTVEKVMEDLADPIEDANGNSLVQRVGAVVYTAVTPLEEGFRDTIELQLQLPADAAGETIAFPVFQSCEVGETDWSELAEDGADAEELEHPAPTVTVTAAETEDAQTADETTADAAAAATPGSEPDTLARVLGIAGIAIGAAGILAALGARRQRVTTESANPAATTEKKDS